MKGSSRAENLSDSLASPPPTSWSAEANTAWLTSLRGQQIHGTRLADAYPLQKRRMVRFIRASGQRRRTTQCAEATTIRRRRGGRWRADVDDETDRNDSLHRLRRRGVPYECPWSRRSGIALGLGAMGSAWRLSIFTGPKGSGKTTLMIELALQQVNHGEPTLYATAIAPAKLQQYILRQAPIYGVSPECAASTLRSSVRRPSGRRSTLGCISGPSPTDWKPSGRASSSLIPWRRSSRALRIPGGLSTTARFEPPWSRSSPGRAPGCRLRASPELERPTRDLRVGHVQIDAIRTR